MTVTEEKEDMVQAEDKMNAKTIMDIWLHRHGLKIYGATTKSKDNYFPLLPFLLADLQNQMYSDYIEPLHNKHLMKKYSKDWRDNYNKVNHMLFSCLNENESYEVCEVMDNLSSLVANDLTMMRIQTMNILKEYDTIHQEVVASGVVANAVAQMAMLIFRRYYSDSTIAYANNYFEAMVKWSYEYYVAYAKQHGMTFNLSNQDQLMQIIQIMIKKIFNYSKEA